MVASKEKSPSANKLVGLELLRFVAGIAVIVWHYQIFAFVGRTPVNFQPMQQPFHSALYLFYTSGFWAVEIFWIISGFIFFWKYREPIADRAVNFGNFFVLRLSRLYPLHFVTLLGVAALQYLYWRHSQSFFYFPNNSANDFTLQVFMVANRAINQDSFNYPIWSVSVELWIYLLFFVTVRFVSRSFIINLMIVGACLWAESKDIKNPLIECAKLFYIGGLMAILRRHLTSRTVAIASTCCAWVIGFVATRWLWTKYGTTPDTFMRIFSCSAAPILLFSFAHIPRLPRVVEKTIETAGNTTYSSYLLHFPIQILVALVCAYNGWIIPMYERGFFLAFMIGTIGSAYFVYRYFEFPAQRLLRRVKIVVDSSPRP